MVQSERGDEDEARAVFESGHAETLHEGRVEPGILRRVCGAGAGQDASAYRDPRRDPQFLQDVPSVAACAGVLFGKSAWDARQDLLQV